MRRPIRRALHPAEGLLRVPRRLQILLRGGQRLVSEPCLHRPHVDPGAQPPGRRCFAEAVEVPFFRIEAREGRYLLAAVVQVAVVEVAFWGAVPWLEAASEDC